MNLGLIQPWMKVLAALLLAAAAFLGIKWRDAGIREEGRAQVRSQFAAQAAREAEMNAKETQRRLDRQKENEDAAAASLAALDVDRARLRAAADGLRKRVAELEGLARGSACRDPAPEGERPTAVAAAGMLAELQRRADERAGILADYADRARIAGLQCQTDYDALTAAPPR